MKLFYPNVAIASQSSAIVMICCLSSSVVVGWRFGAVGSDVGQINEVTLRRARSVLGWVTVWGSTPRARNLSQSNQLPRLTQPGHPSVSRRDEYRSKGSVALRLGVKALGRYGVVCR